LRNAHNLNVLVVLTFSLNENAPFPVKDAHALQAALDWSPPSLYLLPRGDEAWLGREFTRSEQLDPSVLNPTSGATSIDVEFRDPETKEPRRVMYVVA
jgi:hypothetical protein